jgi:hypothetical protein
MVANGEYVRLLRRQLWPISGHYSRNLLCGLRRNMKNPEDYCLLGCNAV